MENPLSNFERFLSFGFNLLIISSNFWSADQNDRLDKHHKRLFLVLFLRLVVVLIRFVHVFKMMYNTIF